MLMEILTLFGSVLYTVFLIIVSLGVLLIPAIILANIYVKKLIQPWDYYWLPGLSMLILLCFEGTVVIVLLKHFHP